MVGPGRASSRLRGGVRTVVLTLVAAAVLFTSDAATTTGALTTGAQTPPVPAGGVGAELITMFGMGGDTGLGLLGDGGSWDLVQSGYSLTDVDPATGMLLPDMARGALTDQYAVTSELAEMNLLDGDVLAVAERARQDAERRRFAQARRGSAHVGDDVPYAALFNAAGDAHGVDPRMLAAVARTESGFRPEVVNCSVASSAGAKGLMQFMPSTAAGHGIDPCVPAQAVDAAAKDLKGYHDTFGSWDLAFAAYNAGPGRVRAAGGVPNITETKNYVVEVNRHWNEYRERYPDGLGESRTESSPVGDICIQKVRGIEVACDVAGSVDAMIGAAEADGVRLGGSGYRSSDGQLAVRRKNCGTSSYAIYEMPASQCSPPTARPGTSMHERGLAIDFTCNGGSVTRSGSCFRWLSAHAATYGFKNLPSEPWHWSTSGR